jgi:hypothetical protein
VGDAGRRARPPTTGWRRLLGGLSLKELASVLTVVGLTLYVVLRVIHSAFYAAFAVKPEEVGLGEVEILTQSAVLMVTLLVMSLTLACLSMLSGFWWWVWLPRVLFHLAKLLRLRNALGVVGNYLSRRESRASAAKSYVQTERLVTTNRTVLCGGREASQPSGFRCSGSRGYDTDQDDYDDVLALAAVLARL